MIYLKEILKFSFFAALAILLCVGIYFLAAYCLSRIEVKNKVSSNKETTIYILTNGVHTDIVLPIKNVEFDWSKEVKFENTVSKDSSFNWVSFGWGDKGFYLNTPTWGDLTFSTAFKAAFSLSTSAIHATFYNQMIESKRCRKIDISKEQYEALVEYIRHSFVYTTSGHLINIKTNANYGKNDAFYEATGSYNLFHTCNTWANNGLKSCGQKACLWTPFDTGIFYHYSKSN